MERAKHILEGWSCANCTQHNSSQTRTPIATSTQPNQSMNTEDSEVRWTKLTRGRLKCNVDATFSNFSNKVGIDICIKNAKGQHIRSRTIWFSLLCSIDIGEA